MVYRMNSSRDPSQSIFDFWVLPFKQVSLLYYLFVFFHVRFAGVLI